MNANENIIESLIEKATDYGKTSLELIKLQALDKTTDIVSSLIPYSLLCILLATFMLFLNLGLAFWIGEVMDDYYFGFFIVAAFYGILAIVLHFFFHQRIKKMISNYIIAKMFK